MVYRTITLPIVALFISSVAISQEEPKQQAMPDPAKVIESTIESFFKGEQPRTIMTLVSDGEFGETAPNPEDLKKTYGESKLIFFKLLFSPDKHTAVMTLKTDSRGTVRWHTFVMMTTANGGSKWEIKSWHSSHV